jgi:outer membrane lipase/esterase
MLMDPMVLARRVAGATIVVLAAVLAASCGGGTEQVEPFVPQQVIALGDETNLLTLDGKNYSVNGFSASGVPDCRVLPVWTQSVAAAWGYVFNECNPLNVTPARAVMRAGFNAKAADLKNQIDAQLAVGPPTSKDLFTVLVGMHDIIELYEQYPGPKVCDKDSRTNDPPATLNDEVSLRGRRVAEQVNRLVAVGARVIVSTVPELSLTPYARAQEAAVPGATALLECMTYRFNARVRVDILQDGRYIGLILADDLILVMADQPSNYGLKNVTDAMCTTAVPDCTTATLVPGATAGSHLWADDRRMGPVAHSQLYGLALTRAQRNPL